MATNSYNIADRTVIDQKLQREIVPARFWTQMSGIATLSNTTRGGQQAWNIPGTPVTTYNHFRNVGMTKMLIPVLGRLKGYGRQGKQTATGFEEEMHWFWQAIFVGYVRKPIGFPTIVDAEKIRWAATVESYRPQIVEWWAAYLDMDLTLAYYQGFSKHITDAEADGGSAKTMRFNPNFWGYRGGVSYRDFSYSPAFDYDAEAYRNNIIDEMALIDGSTDNTFDHYTLEAISANLAYSRIKGWKNGSSEIYPLIIHSLQAKTLRQDSSWLTAQGQGGVRGDGNKIFKGEIGRWGKLVVIENDLVARLPYYVVGGSTPTDDILNFFDYDIGADDTSSGRWQLPQMPPATVGSVQNVACALLIGASSMNEGIYQDLKYIKKESSDYEAVTGMAGTRFYGYARNDAYNEFLGEDSPTTPTDRLPCQSAIIMTRVSQ